MPGWNKDSIGYHADDGKLFHERGFGANFGPTCTTGELIDLIQTVSNGHKDCLRLREKREREVEREIKRDRQRGRQRDRQRDRQGDRQRDRQSKRQRQR